MTVVFSTVIFSGKSLKNSFGEPNNYINYSCKGLGHGAFRVVHIFIPHLIYNKFYPLFSINFWIFPAG